MRTLRQKHALEDKIRELHGAPLIIEYYRAKVEEASNEQEKVSAHLRLGSEAGQVAILAYRLMKDPELSADAFRPIFKDMVELTLSSYYSAAVIAKETPEIGMLVVKDLTFDVISTVDKIKYTPKRKEKRASYLLHKLRELQAEAALVPEPRVS